MQQKEQLLRAEEMAHAVEETKEAAEFRHQQVVNTLSSKSEANEQALKNVIEADREARNNLMNEIGK